MLFKVEVKLSTCKCRKLTKPAETDYSFSKDTVGGTSKLRMSSTFLKQ